MVHFPRGPASRYAPFPPHLWSDVFGIEGADSANTGIASPNKSPAVTRVRLGSPVIDALLTTECSASAWRNLLPTLAAQCLTVGSTLKTGRHDPPGCWPNPWRGGRHQIAPSPFTASHQLHRHDKLRSLGFSPEYTIVGIHRPLSTVFIVPSFSRSTLPGDPIDASEMAFYSPKRPAHLREYIQIARPCCSRDRSTLLVSTIRPTPESPRRWMCR